MLLEVSLFYDAISVQTLRNGIYLNTHNDNNNRSSRRFTRNVTVFDGRFLTEISIYKNIHATQKHHVKHKTGLIAKCKYEFRHRDEVFCDSFFSYYIKLN